MLGLWLIFSVIVPQTSCPSLPDVYSFFREAKLEMALEGADCLLSISPGDGDLKQLRADILWRLGRYEAAKRAYQSLSGPPSWQSHRRASDHRISFSYDQAYSDPRDTRGTSAEMRIRYWEASEAALGFRWERREFAGGVDFQDHQIQWMNHLQWDSRYYLAANLFFTPGSDFFPRVEGMIEPHIVWRRWDFSLASKFRQYEDLNSFSLKPQMRMELSDYVSFFFFGEFTVQPDYTNALGAGTDIYWVPQFSSRLQFAGGRSDEGAGVFDDFLEIRVRNAIVLFSSFEWGADLGYYFGDRRDEKSFSISAGYIF